MVYSASLAARVRHSLRNRPGVVEKKMFGGVGFLLHGNMLVGIWQQSLIARVGPDAGPAALARPHVREFDVTGRPMRGWVMVDPDALDSDRQLTDWVDLSLQYVATLPAKAPGSVRRPTKKTAALRPAIQKPPVKKTPRRRREVD